MSDAIPADAAAVTTQQMSKWADADVADAHDEAHMSKWADEQMSRWGNEQISCSNDIKCFWNIATIDTEAKDTSSYQREVYRITQPPIAGFGK